MPDPFSTTGFGRPQDIFDVGPGDLVEMTMERMEGWQDWQELQKTAMMVTGEVMREQERTMNIMRQEANNLRATMASAKSSIAGTAAAGRGAIVSGGGGAAGEKEVGGGRIFANVAAFDAWAHRAYARAGRSSGAAPPGGGGGVGGGGLAFGGGSSDIRRQTTYALWYMRAISAQIRVIQQLGQQLTSTATTWALYAARQEEAANAAAGIIHAGGELSTVLVRQRTVAADMNAELGGALLPAYKASIEVVTNLKQSVAELNDGWQAAIGVGTVVAGTVMQVGGSVAQAVMTISMMTLAWKSLELGMQTATLSWLRYGVAAAAVVTIVASLAVLHRSLESELQQSADVLGEFALKWGLTGREMAKMAAGFYDNLSAVGKAVFNLKGGMDAFLERMQESGSSLSVIFKNAVKAVEAMELPAARAFQNFADAQASIQNEMETKRREHAHIMERIDSGMYREQDVAQATALGAQIRRLELADAAAVRSHKRQMEQIVLQTVSALERIGHITPEEALAARGAAFLEAGGTEEAVTAGRAWLEEQFPGVLGAGAEASVVIPGEFTVTQQVVALEDNTNKLVDVKDAIYDWLEGIVAGGPYGPGGSGGGAGGVGGRTVGDELSTQGVRNRR